MCTGQDQQGRGAPASVAEALRAAHQGLDYLNSPAGGELEAAAVGEVLRSLGELRAKFAAAHAGLLRRFDAADAHDSDGYGSSAAWLAAMTKMSRKAARGAVRQARRQGEHRQLEEAMARGELSESWFAEVEELTRKLPAGLRGQTDKILLEAAAGGADLEDLKVIAAAACERWRAQRPDPDDDDGFDDRYIQVGTTFGGAACVRGNLTPECGAAVQAVLEALGKRHGPEDHRSEGQRFHDALQLGCELLIRARMVPDRAGADTQVIAHTPLSQLRAMPGASALEQAWLGAGLGQPGYLAGQDGEAAACDAMIVPVVTGHADMTVIDTIIELALAAFDHDRHTDDSTSGAGSAGSDGGGTVGSESTTGSAGSVGSESTAGSDGSAGTAGSAGSPGGVGSESAVGGDGHSGGGARMRAMSPAARDALRHAIARLAADFLSGPGGLASTLRAGLLTRPFSTPSLPLDIGYSESIPAHIRRAVILRDRHCAWPRCGRPAAWCDVHHIVHKQDGGTTSLSNCILLCQFHHDVCIHRWGWQIILHPDGTTSAYGPHGQVQHSHSPPTTRAG